MKISWYRDFLLETIGMLSQKQAWHRDVFDGDFVDCKAIYTHVQSKYSVTNTRFSLFFLSSFSQFFSFQNYNIFSNIQCIQITYYNSKIIERKEMRTSREAFSLCSFFLQSCFSFSIFLNRIILSIEIQQLNIAIQKKKKRKRTHLNSLRP